MSSKLPSPQQTEHRKKEKKKKKGKKLQESSQIKEEVNI
jgi:hypothetical protein